eukprot:5048308-Amphidinium_carterae.1
MRSGTQLRSYDGEDGRKQVVTCSQGGVFGVQKQLSVSALDQEVPSPTFPVGVVRDNTSADSVQVGTCSVGEFFGVPQRRSGVTRSAHPACRAHS